MPDLFDNVDKHLWGKGRIRIDPQKQQWVGIQPADRELWERAYPSLDVDRELAAMLAWCLANPKRGKGKKTSYERFITNWMSRNQKDASQFSPGTRDVGIDEARRALGIK